jgi:hypothetical protein
MRNKLHRTPKHSSEDLKGRDHFLDLGSEEDNIKIVLKEIRREDVDWFLRLRIRTSGEF